MKKILLLGLLLVLAACSPAVIDHSEQVKEAEAPLMGAEPVEADDIEDQLSALEEKSTSPELEAQMKEVHGTEEGLITGTIIWGYGDLLGQLFTQ